MSASERNISRTGDGASIAKTKSDQDGGGSRQLTVQEKVDLTGSVENLSLPQFRLDPERSFGHPVTISLQLKYRGINSEMSVHRLTPDERGFFCSSIIHTLSRLIRKKSPALCKERKQFSRYTDLLLQLKEDSASLLYSYQGVRIPIVVYCRSLEELEEIWSHYQQGVLQEELQVYFNQMYLPLGPISVDVKIYDYEECKRKFRFAGYRLLYLQFPQLTKRR